MCILACSLYSMGLPVETSERYPRDDGFGFPTGQKTVEERTEKGCFNTVTRTYNVITKEELIDGKIEEITKIVNETVETSECCVGYAGVNCNIRIDPFSASDPCTNKTCPSEPEAQCAVINQCGSQVAVFLNEFGEIVECDTEDEEETDVDIITVSCQGYCTFDPCANQVCESFPDEAQCFQSGCDCEPIWILDTGVQVNCTSGEHVDPLLSVRNRRQAVTAPLPASCR